MIDVLIALTILTVSIVSLLSLVVASLKLERVNRESTQAVQAARRELENLRSLPFDQIFALRNTTPLDDPGGTGTAQGASFAVNGLTAQAGDLDELPGEIAFPAIGASLFESFVDAGLSMPRDLNLDGVIDGANHASDYRVLPVRVRVRWRGTVGDCEFEISSVLRDD